MLVSKKPKLNEDKGKHKAAEAHPKKPKKPKNSSPGKSKGTPEKKKARKDENSQCNKPSAASGQHSEYYKSRQSQRHVTFHKKSQNKEVKSKLLTTSPILFEHSKSKSKSKEKSRSISKLNTYRSTQDKELFNKSITKRLFPQPKQNKSRSKEKSKSRSRLKTDRDVSPLKEIKQPKRFDVADREIKYNKHETSELKKTMKKKIQNSRSKAEPFLYPADPAEESQEPKVKLKKKVPQIKTEFSERRGSYFDENLLRKLEASKQEVKNAECPFLHIKSNFQERRKQNVSFHSRSEARAMEESSASSRSRKMELFKREQERKWAMMLSELQNLKNEPQVAERIDVLIEYLNQNYASLQEKALELSAKEHKSVEANHQVVHFDSIITSSPKSSTSEQDFLRHLALQKEIQVAKHSPQQLQKDVILKDRGSNDAFSVQSDKSSLKFLSPISFENQLRSQVLEPALSEKEVVFVGKEAEEPQAGEMVFKRSTNISLSDFYNLVEKQEGERKVQFEPFLKLTQEDIDNFSAQIIREEAEHKISDRNILHDLNILDSSYDGRPDISNKTEEFRQEMERHRRKETALDDCDGNFHNEVRISEDMSSESLLLNASDNLSRKEWLVEEVEQAMVLDFCVTILRSKTLLHNFITTYSQLVESNVINTNIGFSDPKRPTESSNEYVRSVVVRLLDYIESSYKQCFLRQVRLPFQCRPIDILKYIRSTEEDILVSSLSEDAGEGQLQAPYFNQQRIEEFEREVLRNEYFIPGYFSFNHCIYDEFNDIFEELRPYGSRGKPIFSLELSHPITDFAVARAEVLRRVDAHLGSKYHQQAISDEKYPNQEGVFEIVYFTAYDVIDLIFQQEALKILSTFELACLKNRSS